ncbi:hypothetical protein GCM10022247_39940 [Allokutzneria multivorans]|uniref:Uncharacterized protein n=1 Tax=Allokutzneria multivorans TaxID=1142134 RepID=A0ABP7SLB2_9PSEU
MAVDRWICAGLVCTQPLGVSSKLPGTARTAPGGRSGSTARVTLTTVPSSEVAVMLTGLPRESVSIVRVPRFWRSSMAAEKEALVISSECTTGASVFSPSVVNSAIRSSGVSSVCSGACWVSPMVLLPRRWSPPSGSLLLVLLLLVLLLSGSLPVVSPVFGSVVFGSAVFGSVVFGSPDSLVPREPGSVPWVPSGSV